MKELDYRSYEKSKYNCPLCGNKLLPSTEYNVFIGKPNKEFLWCYFCKIESSRFKNLNAAYKDIIFKFGQLNLFEGDFM